MKEKLLKLFEDAQCLSFEIEKGVEFLKSLLVFDPQLYEFQVLRHNLIY
jgi:hypothetical protein